MGSVCGRSTVPHIEENAASNSSSSGHGNCICPSCFIKNKYRALFGRLEMHDAPSFQGAASSITTVAPNNTHLVTNRQIPNNANPQVSQLQQGLMNMGIRNDVEQEVIRRTNVQTIPKTVKQNGPCSGEASKETKPESSEKILFGNVESGVGTVGYVSCPTEQIPNNANPQVSQLQPGLVNMGIRNDVEPEVIRRTNVQIIIPKTVSEVVKQTGPCSGEASKESKPESSEKILLENVESGVGTVGYVSCPTEEEEDVCPTCLEEYTTENPKIITQCHHDFHLSCIYEWMERSEKCPVCSQLMLFEES